MEIVIIRHGQTDMNVKGIMSGQSDFARLTQKGLLHALNLVRILRKIGVDGIFASPLTRAQQTATPFSQNSGLPIIVESALIEFNFGDLDNRPNLAAKYYEDKRRDDLSYHFPHGESYSEVIARLEPFCQRLENSGLHRPACFTHGGILRPLLVHFMGLDISNPQTLTNIAISNEVIYVVNTADKSCKWINTLEDDHGFGIFYRK